jgi:hypothetical protein
MNASPANNRWKGREAWFVWRRGRPGTVCARGANRALLCGVWQISKTSSTGGCLRARTTFGQVAKFRCHSRGSKENDIGAPIFNWPKSACRGFRT